MSSNGWDLPPPNGSGADLPPPGDADNASEPRWFNQRVAGVPAWGVFGAAVLIWIVVVAIALRGGGGDESNDLSFQVTTPTVARTAAPAETVATAVPTTEPAATTDAPSTTAEVAATTAPTSASTVAETAPTTEAAVDATTEAAATTAPPTTEPAATTTSPPATSTTTTTTAPPTTTTTTTTVPPTTTTTPPPVATEIVISGAVTATGPGGEQLTVTPRRGPCRYGPDCFVAAFQISGFSYQPQEFVCEFSSGARYVFKFSSAGADPACSTLDVPDSIVVHVGGLRTEPVTIGERLPTTP